MQILHIVINSILSLIAIGFIIWLFYWTLKRSDDPAKLIFKWIFTGIVVWYVITHIMPDFAAGGFAAIFGLVQMLLVGLAMTVTWRHSIIGLIADPLGALYDGGKSEIEPKPYYSIAQAQ